MATKPKRNLTKEQEVLNSQVRLDGVGEDPVIQALVSDEFATMSDTEALDIALALQQLIRGQAALLNNQAEQGREIARIKEQMHEQELAAKRWENEREEYLTEINNRAERLKVTGNAKDRIIAQAVQIEKDARAQAVVARADKRLRLDQKLAMEPKVKIMDMGRPIIVREGAHYRHKLEAETIQIAHRRFVFPPGREVEVPLTVAKEYEKRKKLRAENEERKDAMSLDDGGTMGNRHQDVELAKRQHEIDEKYGTHTDAYPLASQ